MSGPAPVLLALPGGVVVAVDGPIVLGRAPFGAADGRPGVRAIAVPSPRAEVSAVHLELRPTSDGVEALDLGSTNGTLLVREGRPVGELEPGRAQAWPRGVELDLGDAVRLRQLAPGERA